MEIPRPGTRIEIVAAMRRVRFEFKARGIKKRPVEITVSVDGVRVVLQRKKKQQKDSAWDESKLLVMFHPIYRLVGRPRPPAQDLLRVARLAGPADLLLHRARRRLQHLQVQRVQVLQEGELLFTFRH